MGQASWPKSSRKGIGIYTPTNGFGASWHIALFQGAHSEEHGLLDELISMPNYLS